MCLLFHLLNVYLTLITGHHWDAVLCAQSVCFVKPKYIFIHLVKFLLFQRVANRGH